MPEGAALQVTDNELYELHTLISILGVMAWQKKEAIERLKKKSLLRLSAKGELELTDSALAMLGKVQVK